MFVREDMNNEHTVQYNKDAATHGRFWNANVTKRIWAIHMSFSFIWKQNIIQNMKNIKLLIIFYRLSQCSCETRSLYDTYVELFHRRFSEAAVAKINVM